MNGKRIAILNHWYPEAFDAWKRQGGRPLHGTADYWDDALRYASGGCLDPQTFVVNEFRDQEAFFHVINGFNPNVVITMEAGRWNADCLRSNFPRRKLLAFCSHRVEDRDLIGFDCVFSSFPWMPDHCRKIGVRCEYLPLAFGRFVLGRTTEPAERDIPVCFVGGLGSRIWKSGTEAMSQIAESVPEFKWWGYKTEPLSQPLDRTFQGPAWGVDYYNILRRTKILVNRHGEICRGWANNCRVYEGAGCGCIVLNDHNCDVRREMVENYGGDPQFAVRLIRQILGTWSGYESVGYRAQREILDHHTFENRAEAVRKIIFELPETR